MNHQSNLKISIQTQSKSYSTLLVYKLLLEHTPVEMVVMILEYIFNTELYILSNLTLNYTYEGQTVFNRSFNLAVIVPRPDKKQYPIFFDGFEDVGQDIIAMCKEYEKTKVFSEVSIYPTVNFCTFSQTCYVSIFQENDQTFATIYMQSGDFYYQLTIPLSHEVLKFFQNNIQKKPTAQVLPYIMLDFENIQ